MRKHDKRVTDGNVHFVSYAMIAAPGGSMNIIGLEVDPPKSVLPKYLIGATILNVLGATINTAILGWSTWKIFS